MQMATLSFIARSGAGPLAFSLLALGPPVAAQTTFSADTAAVRPVPVGQPVAPAPAAPPTGEADPVVAGALAPTAAATRATPAAPDTASIRELRRLNEQWAEAAVRNDAETMNQLMAPDYVFINSRGQIQQRPDLLNAVTNGRAKTTVNKGFDYLIRVCGDVGVVMHNTSFVGSLNGKNTSGEYRATHTYVRRNGRWQLASSQATSVAAPDPRLDRKPGTTLDALR